MDVIRTTISYTEKIKKLLIFFYVFTLFNCSNTKNDALSITYENGIATSIVFSAQGSVSDYSVTLQGQEQRVLGEYQKERSQIRFIPVIPFSAGENYQIVKKGELFLAFQTQQKIAKDRPKVVGIYPAIDTVPENLLKMHFVFSKPMQQSAKTLDFIKVYNEQNEETSIFLELENELWSVDRTELTLWLDPGRIKKDLIPNKKLGNPLEEGKTYTITILGELDDAEGIAIGKNTEKKIVVTEKDQVKPNVHDWQLTIPTVDTKEALGISFLETLDYFLLEETIQVYQGDQALAGGFMISKKANCLLFIPKNAWKKGSYRIVVESRLEDVAGNNLNRLFDHDLTTGGEVTQVDSYPIPFTIQ